jgi:hypothetical protein
MTTWTARKTPRTRTTLRRTTRYDAPGLAGSPLSLIGERVHQDARHAEELAAEAAGVSYSQYKAEQKQKKRQLGAAARPRKHTATTEAEEERQLAKKMMRPKDVRLMRKLQADTNRRRAEVRASVALSHPGKGLTRPRGTVRPGGGAGGQAACAR